MLFVLNWIIPIVKPDMLEGDTAVGHLHKGMSWILDVRLLVDDLYHTLSTGRTLCEHHKNHAEHHQRHENRHHIGEQGCELTGGQRSTYDEVGTEPRQGNHTAIDHHIHNRMVPCHESLSLDKQTIESLGGTSKLLVLVILTHKGLYHPDGRHILLHALVQLVVLLIDFGEELRHM